MKNNKKRGIDNGILTMSIIQFMISGSVLLGSILTLIVDYGGGSKIKAARLPAEKVSSIIGLIIVIAVIIGVILILNMKRLGIYLYFIAEIASKIHTNVVDGFSLLRVVLDIIPFSIVPILMAIFIYKRKEIFAVKPKHNINVNQQIIN